jgi:hypothetical protein
MSRSRTLPAPVFKSRPETRRCGFPRWTLTREEITFAWVKVGWETSLGGGSRATESFLALQEILVSHGLKLELDELMSLVSTLWAAKHNSGELLGDRDLLSGDKIRPLAEKISVEWTRLSECVTEFCGILAERRIKYREHYSSLNALAILLTWIWIGVSWSEGRTLSELERDDFDKRLIGAFRRFCDRWLILSSWSGKYSERTGAVVSTYVKDLYGLFNTLKSKSQIGEVDSAVAGWMQSACDELVPEAESYLDGLNVPLRDQVSQYRVALWLWHRLDEARWQDSQIGLRTKKAKDLLVEVDHIFSIKSWDDICKKQGLPNQMEENNPINQLGNCILLEKDLISAKGKNQRGNFFPKCTNSNTTRPESLSGHTTLSSRRPISILRHISAKRLFNASTKGLPL